MKFDQFPEIEKERIKLLNNQPLKQGGFVLYWMQATQRTEHNQALDYAIMLANKLNQPLLVYFAITNSYPEANERHYYFMLEGLKQVQTSFEEKNLQFLIQNLSPEVGVCAVGKEASAVVVDAGYSKTERQLRNYVASHVSCPLVQLECNVVVPVELVSPKEEYSAATIRRKIMKQVTKFLVLNKQPVLEKTKIKTDFSSFEISDLDKAVKNLNFDKSVKRVKTFHGGTSHAKKHLKLFIETKLEKYDNQRNDPTKNVLSNMSAYLHFGQISPIFVALNVLESNNQGMDTYLEQLIVRRELAFNFVFYNNNYDCFDGLPEWTKKSLNEHKDDTREYVYSLDELEKAKTHDVYWNAAQKQMIICGKMHGYMRMYWGKKIIEWTNDPQTAYEYILYLNNKYELDGRDPNGFTGVAWCFGKHDRPWKERSVFGKIRYMNAKGLQRKFNIEKYVKQIDQLT
ncbi:MAG: deoxyribodipyrimidine photo-lyase [Candidatus Bathyarchaeum tardum]|nr:MAG: deoxyribodipyrimidine photo-lyase [Candidatus Bathyarchaeum tardum]